MTFLVTGTYILTDAIYNAYGGDLSAATPSQRQAAYQIAEQFAIQEIGTFLTPTTVTGTFEWPQSGYRLQLPYNQVTSVNSVVALHELSCGCTPTEISGCAWLIDSDGGVIDLRQCGSSASCPCAIAQGLYYLPKLVRISYTAGLPAGRVAANAGALMGLVTAADLALEQILDPAGAEGGPGDPSIASFSDTGYGEVRQFLKLTAFGGSPRANYAARMLRPLKVKRALRFT